MRDDSKHRPSPIEAIQEAKLMDFNNRALSIVEAARGQLPELGRKIDALGLGLNVGPSAPLNNQANLLGLGYICLVWLRESAWPGQTKDWREQVLVRVEKDFPQWGAIAKQAKGPRKIDTCAEFLRTVRNALSHAKVKIEERASGRYAFVVADIDTRRGEKEHTSMELTNADFGRLCYTFLFAVNAVAFQQVEGECPSSSDIDGNGDIEG